MNGVIKISYILTSSFLLSTFGNNFKYCWLTNVSLSCRRDAKSGESPPAFSSGFALSCSEVFTINVRLLFVNTSINTAQRFTAYASFRLSHLLNGRNRTKSKWRNLSLITTPTDIKVQWLQKWLQIRLKIASQRLSGHKQSLFVLHSDSWLRLI